MCNVLSYYRVYPFTVERETTALFQNFVIEQADLDGNPPTMRSGFRRAALRFSRTRFWHFPIFSAPWHNMAVSCCPGHRFFTLKESREKYNRSVEPISSPIAVQRSVKILAEFLFRKELVIVLLTSIRLVLTDYTWAGFDLPTTSIIFCSCCVTLTETRNEDDTLQTSDLWWSKVFGCKCGSSKGIIVNRCDLLLVCSIFKLLQLWERFDLVHMLVCLWCWCVWDVWNKISTMS